MKEKRDPSQRLLDHDVVDIEIPVGEQAEEPRPRRLDPPVGDALHQRNRRDGRPPAPVGHAASRNG